MPKRTLNEVHTAVEAGPPHAPAPVTARCGASRSGARRRHSARPQAAQWREELQAGILERQDWGAREPDHDAENETGFYGPDNPEGWRVYEGDLRAIYRTVVVHHSVLYETDDPGTMRAIQQQHMELRGWADIAYHFGVGQSAQVFAGRPLNVRGTHVEGFNTGSVGVVFLGDFSLNVPAPAQIEAGRRLIDWLALRLELTHLAGHSDFNSGTDCPGQYLQEVLGALAESAGLALGTGGYVPDQV